jgi:hypothetical protein
MGLGFPVFSLKKPDLTEPDRFEPVSGPVRLIFYKNTVIRFGWFFESKPNRTEPWTPLILLYNSYTWLI